MLPASRVPVLIISHGDLGRERTGSSPSIRNRRRIAVLPATSVEHRDGVLERMPDPIERRSPERLVVLDLVQTLFDLELCQARLELLQANLETRRILGARGRKALVASVLQAAHAVVEELHALLDLGHAHAQQLNDAAALLQADVTVMVSWLWNSNRGEVARTGTGSIWRGTGHRIQLLLLLRLHACCQDKLDSEGL